MRTYKIEKNDSDQRIDKFIRKAVPKLSLPSIYKHIRKKNITVNDKKIDINYKLQLEDIVKIYLNDDITTKEKKATDFLSAKDILDVIYEDENIIVVNKPIGIVVQDDETKNPDTLNNRLLKYLHKKNEWDQDKETNFIPSFVHRLDRNTKGLIVGAKNVVSSRILSEKIKDREIEKYYLAKIHGIITPKQAVLTAYLTEQEHNTVKISKKPLSNESKQIVTEYKTISHDENTSIIEVHLITGRKHQIRAHMNFINHPLVGERKYTNEFAKKDSKSYQYLISYKIVFNFKQNSGTLSYLKNKEIVLKNF